MENTINLFKDEIIKSEDKIKSIYIKGSKRTLDTIDYWSDTDLLVVLEKDIEITEDIILNLKHAFTPIIGSQIYEYDGGITFRVTSGNTRGIIQYDIQILTYSCWKMYCDGMSKDITCIYGMDESQENVEAYDSEDNYEYNYDENAVNNVWFMYFESIKKFARKDNLIGMHLLLELIKEYLVLEMIERDIKVGTNIHRYGKCEEFPNELELNMLQHNNLQERFIFIKKLAKLYDEKLKSFNSNYFSRYEFIERHIDKSISLINGGNQDEK